MKLNKKLSYLIKNIGYITIGNFASKIMNFILIPIYTAKLSTGEYGSADLIFTTMSLLIPVLSLEINEAVMRYSLDGTHEKNHSTFTIGVLISIFSIVVFLILFPIILLFNTFYQYWFYIIMMYISNLMYICLSQFAKGNKYIKEYSVCGFVNTVITAVLNIVFLMVFELKIEGYLLSYILGYIGASIYLLLALRKDIRIVPIRAVDYEYVKQMLRYSVPLIPNAVCWWINNAADKYMLAIFCNTATIGLYSIAYKIPSLLSIISSIFFSAWQISAVEDFGKEDGTIFYSKIYRTFFAINALMCIVLVVFSKSIAYVLYANEFFEAWKYSVVLICAYFFNSISTFLGTIYTTSKKTNMLLISSIIAALINIVLNFVFIPMFGIYGAAIATLISYLVIFVIRLYDTKKIMPLNYSVIECAIHISMMVIAVLVSYYDNQIVRLIALLLFSIYVLFVFRLHGIKNDSK